MQKRIEELEALVGMLKEEMECIKNLRENMDNSFNEEPEGVEAGDDEDIAKIESNPKEAAY
jgi:hypothetical protein